MALRRQDGCVNRATHNFFIETDLRLHASMPVISRYELPLAIFGAPLHEANG